MDFLLNLKPYFYIHFFPLIFNSIYNKLFKK